MVSCLATAPGPAVNPPFHCTSHRRHRAGSQLTTRSIVRRLDLRITHPIRGLRTCFYAASVQQVNPAQWIAHPLRTFAVPCSASAIMRAVRPHVGHFTSRYFTVHSGSAGKPAELATERASFKASTKCRARTLAQGSTADPPVTSTCRGSAGIRCRCSAPARYWNPGSASIPPWS